MVSLAVIFPGQGSQRQGMGLDFIDQQEKSWFEQADQLLDFDLHQLLVEGTDQQLARTRYTQPAIFVVSQLIYRRLKAAGIKADYFAGHSLGEYNALVASGRASFEQLLPVVQARGRAMDEQAEKLSGGMAAILKLAPDKLEQICQHISTDPAIEGQAELSLFNAPGQLVVSGSDAALEAVVEQASQAGALKAVRLDVSGPWHSSYMAPAIPRLERELEQVDWKAGKPYLPNVDGEVFTGTAPVKQLLDQLVKPVNWVKTIETLLQDGVETFVEVGPGKVLSGLVKRIARNAGAKPTVYQTDNIEKTKKTLEAIS